MDEVAKLVALIEAVALGEPYPRKRHENLKHNNLIYPTYEIKTASMLRVYYMKVKGTGKIIVLGHIKGNKKDQEKQIRRVAKIQKELRQFMLSNKLEFC